MKQMNALLEENQVKGPKRMGNALPMRVTLAAWAIWIPVECIVGRVGQSL